MKLDAAPFVPIPIINLAFRALFSIIRKIIREDRGQKCCYGIMVLCKISLWIVFLVLLQTDKEVIYVENVQFVMIRGDSCVSQCRRCRCVKWFDIDIAWKQKLINRKTFIRINVI